MMLGLLLSILLWINVCAFNMFLHHKDARPENNLSNSDTRTSLFLSLDFNISRRHVGN